MKWQGNPQSERLEDRRRTRPGRGVLGSILDGVQAVGNVLDVPGSMLRDALAGQNPLDQLANPFSDTGRTSGRDLLRKYGMAGQQDTWGNFLGGMAAEAVLDPTNLIPAGVIGKHLSKVGKVGKANKAIDAANALSLKQRAMGFMPEEIVGLTKIAENGTPKQMYHGTGHSFDQYDMNRMDPTSLYGKGIYTTDNPHIASSYTTKGEPSNEQILDYFQPGKAIPSWGGMDEVVDVVKDEAGRFKEVNVRALDGPMKGRLRTHATLPDIKEAGNGNVRSQFLDIRNPLDIEAMYGPGGLDMPPQVQELLTQQQRTRARESISQNRWMKRKIAEGNPKYTPGMLAEQQELLRSSFAKRNSVPSTTGKDIYRRVGREGLPTVGFDGITHLGGQVTGGDPHNVAIAFDPSQVYKPYIAKSLKQKLPTPKAPRLGTTLGAYHLLRSGSHDQ